MLGALLVGLSVSASGKAAAPLGLLLDLRLATGVIVLEPGPAAAAPLTPPGTRGGSPLELCPLVWGARPMSLSSSWRPRSDTMDGALL
mmetsp:Transcript_8564/g.14414  ORF Transcript_8564/g.14414 Transcript_8564/m.14414 type:complete len:88 (-) Transcript_8564:571-834(-)